MTEWCCYEAELHRIKGELLLTETVADQQQAEACFQNASNIARAQSAHSLELRAAMSSSRLERGEGEEEEELEETVSRNLLGGLLRASTRRI